MVGRIYLAVNLELPLFQNDINISVNMINSKNLQIERKSIELPIFIVVWLGLSLLGAGFKTGLAWGELGWWVEGEGLGGAGWWGGGGGGWA